MRALPFVLCFTLTAGVTVFSPFVARAQVSDSDRAAARDLYFEAVKLQDSGKFAEALDRFDRAQRIFSAPTHLLHIAECQAAMGKLVESAESYRALIRTPLPQGSPPAFHLAQQQAVAELPQVEPRIPQVKIDVTPPNVPNLQVQLDGLTVNPALVGVSRPIDPGQHKLAMFAPGYGKQEQTFAVKERENKVVPVALVATSGVSYGPAVVPQPPPPYVGQPQPQPQPQPPPNSDQWKTAPKPPSTSLLFGVRAGALFPTGSAFANTAGILLASIDNTPMSDLASAGGAFGIDGGIRFGTHFFGGISYEHGFLGKGDKQPAAGVGDAKETVSTNYFGGNLAYISNPEGFGFYGEIGLGYRWFGVSSSLNNIDASTILKGAEFELGAGAWIRAGNFRIIPKVSFNVGSFTKRDIVCTGLGCGATGTDMTSVSGSVDNTATHTFIFLGVGGFYNLDFGGTPAAASAPPPQ